MANIKASETFAPWDPAEYIDSREDARLYLEAAMDEDEGDGRLVRTALDAVVRAQNVRELARRTGLHRGTLYKTLSADGNPSFTTVLTVMRALGFRLRVESVETPRTPEATL